MVNAVTHRDYTFRGDHVRITIFEDRLEIFSPSKLPNIVTVENIKTTRYSRNPRIARTLTEFGWVRELNEGVKRIYTEMEKSFLNDPIYSEPGECVVLKLENNILNRNIRVEDKVKRLIESDIYDELSYVEKEILKVAVIKKRVTATELATYLGKSAFTIRKYLKKLTNLEILEWFGTSIKDPTQFYSLKTCE